MNFDSRGIPGVSVVTTGFTDAVETQSKALGFEPAILYVPHPIQNRTADELKQLADDAAEKALRICGQQHATRSSIPGRRRRISGRWSTASVETSIRTSPQIAKRSISCRTAREGWAVRICTSPHA